MLSKKKNTSLKKSSLNGRISPIWKEVCKSEKLEQVDGGVMMWACSAATCPGHFLFMETLDVSAY